MFLIIEMIADLLIEGFHVIRPKIFEAAPSGIGKKSRGKNFTVSNPSSILFYT